MKRFLTTLAVIVLLFNFVQASSQPLYVSGGIANALPGKVLTIGIYARANTGNSSNLDPYMISMIGMQTQLLPDYELISVESTDLTKSFAFGYAKDGDTYNILGAGFEPVKGFGRICNINILVSTTETRRAHRLINFTDIFLNQYDLGETVANIMLDTTLSIDQSFTVTGPYTLCFGVEPMWGGTFPFPTSWSAFSYNPVYGMQSVSSGVSREGYIVNVTFRTGYGTYGVPVLPFTMELEDGLNLVPTTAFDQPLPFPTDPPNSVTPLAIVMMGNRCVIVDTIPAGYSGIVYGNKSTGWISGNQAPPDSLMLAKANTDLLAEAERLMAEFNIQPEVVKAKEFSLAQNYPNPFNPMTTIQYTLAEAGNVSVKVYDILGRQVAILEEGVKFAGMHSVVWNGANSASGMYFYHIKYEGSGTRYEYTNKMLLVK